MPSFLSQSEIRSIGDPTDLTKYRSGPERAQTLSHALISLQGRRPNRTFNQSARVHLDFVVPTLYKLPEYPNEGGKMQSDSIATVNGSNETRPDIAPLNEENLPEAERIFRVAFGTFLGAPEPEVFWADRDYVYGRHRAPHVAAFGATIEGKLVGSNFATKWGSVGFFGPITVRPDLQERGIAQALLAMTMEQFDAWETRHVGLFTFPQSAKHISLYQKHGFYARFLTAIMSAPVGRRPSMPAGWSRFSNLNVAQQNEALLACQDIADTLYPGLDLTEEIRATQAQGLGDTVLLEGISGIAAFAVCHYGPRSEAGADACFIKFGAVRTGAAASTIIFGCSMRARPGGRGWHAKRIRRSEYGSPRGLSKPGRSRISHGNSRRDNASAQRSRLLPSGDLRHRRLAITHSVGIE